MSCPPQAADAARRSRGSGRRMQAPPQGAPHDAPTATRGCLPKADGGVATFPQPGTLRAGQDRTAGSRPRPTGDGNVAAAPGRSRQGTVTRAACRPPLRPNETHTMKICPLRRFVGRSLDPAARTFRQARFPPTNRPPPTHKRTPPRPGSPGAGVLFQFIRRSQAQS